MALNKTSEYIKDAFTNSDLLNHNYLEATIKLTIKNYYKNIFMKNEVVTVSESVEKLNNNNNNNGKTKYKELSLNEIFLIINEHHFTMNQVGYLNKTFGIFNSLYKVGKTAKDNQQKLLKMYKKLKNGFIIDFRECLKKKLGNINFLLNLLNGIFNITSQLKKRNENLNLIYKMERFIKYEYYIEENKIELFSRGTLNIGNDGTTNNSSRNKNLKNYDLLILMFSEFPEFFNICNSLLVSLLNIKINNQSLLENYSKDKFGKDLKELENELFVIDLKIKSSRLEEFELFKLIFDKKGLQFNEKIINLKINLNFLLEFMFDVVGAQQWNQLSSKLVSFDINLLKKDKMDLFFEKVGKTLKIKNYQDINLNSFSIFKNLINGEKVDLPFKFLNLDGKSIVNINSIIYDLLMCILHYTLSILKNNVLYCELIIEAIYLNNKNEKN